MIKFFFLKLDWFNAIGIMTVALIGILMILMR